MMLAELIELGIELVVDIAGTLASAKSESKKEKKAKAQKRQRTQKKETDPWEQKGKQLPWEK